MKEVLTTAVEAEVGALFHNSKEACPLHIALTKVGQPQHSTILSTNNSTAAGISNSTVKQRRSKAINMRYYWVCYRVSQGQFTVVWKKGKDKLAEYFTKHHPNFHHAGIRSTYLYHLANPARNFFKLLAEDKEEAPT
jgi:S-adenosylhomocysteine hydrolase